MQQGQQMPVPVSPGYVPPLYPSQSFMAVGQPPQFDEKGDVPAGVQSVQPGATHSMIVGVDPKNVKGLLRDTNGERDWSHGMCDCMGDCGTCCLGWFCPCILYAKNKSRVEHLNRTGQVHPDGGDSFSSDCWVHCLLTSCLGAGWICQIGSRGKIRERYAIQGGSCSDCCSVFWCSPCELTQESREIEMEERVLMGKSV